MGMRGEPVRLQKQIEYRAYLVVGDPSADVLYAYFLTNRGKTVLCRRERLQRCGFLNIWVYLPRCSWTTINNAPE